MYRRKFNSLGLSLLLAGVLPADPASASPLDQITSADALAAMRVSLERGARSAVGQLGRPNGFLGNERVRIPLPRQLQDVEGLLRRIGQGDRLDELVTGMNRAAEAAVPYAQGLMLGAVRQMTVQDAKKILSGGDTSVTRFFAEKTHAPLTAKFLPIVKTRMDKIGVASKYNEIAGQAADRGLMDRDDAQIERYVTAKSLDGLFLAIGDEERRIRRDPVATGSELLGKVFGALL